MAYEFYETLEVPKTASQDDIQKAYRNLARKYHPDMNPDDPGAKGKFQKVQEAYDVLGNQEKRKIYDQFGVDPAQAPHNPQGGQGPFTWDTSGGYRQAGRGSRGGGYEAEFNLNDIFEMFSRGSGAGGMGGDFSAGGGEGGFDPFGQTFSQQSPRRSRRAAAQKGADISHKITIPFKIAVMGGKFTVSLQRPDGKLEDIRVTIPVGIEDGKKIRLREQGAPGISGAKPGDLLLEINVAEHPNFHRKGDNLYAKVAVNLHEAVFGATIELPTPKGEVRLKVPAGSSSGTKLRVKECGVPKAVPGDLFVELMVTLPKKWSEKDKEAIRQLDSATTKPVRADLKW